MFLSLLNLISCKKEQVEVEQGHGNIVFNFLHYVNGSSVITDSMIYTNAAGNDYLITEIQYFISDVLLHKDDGSRILIDDWEDIHYVDNDIPSTMRWEVYDEIPEGDYDSISFTFGICEEKNYSLRFVNPPESFMTWPEYLGGGYHYLKLNGKWSNDTLTQNRPFEFHLGIGQIYDTNNVVVDFIQNFFSVSLPNSTFNIEKEKTVELNIVMNIENWFQNPYVYDHGNYEENTMQNQEAIHKGCMNGKMDVFFLGSR
jgi:hypothetical protein